MSDFVSCETYQKMQDTVFKSSIKKLQIIAPYAIAALFLLILIVVKVSDHSWISGITSNYLSVHIVLEFVGILVSFAIFTVGWATYQNARDSDILVLSIASFAVGALDLGHTLSFTGMPDFFGPSGPNKAISFWLASRAIGSLAFLYIALSPPRFSRLRSLQWFLLSAVVAVVTLTFWAILFHPDILPTFFIQGQGLMKIKVTVEWFWVAVACSAGILLFVDAEKRANMNVRWMACASLLYGMAGYFFTIYKDFEDLFNFMGHFFKAVSYLLLYRAVFVECVSRPYERVQQLAAEAEASNLSKSRFLANVSHEFRTPLGVIGGFGDLLLESAHLEEPHRGWAQTIVRNSKQLSLLIDDLLDLAKAETEKIEIRLSQFELGPLVEQVKQSLEMQGRNNVSLRIENKMPGTGTVITDELRLRQILMNLVGNALKFTPQGQITISLHRPTEHSVAISVEDTGIGIEASQTPRLFQPFSQVSNPSDRRFGGTGLGLSLSRKLAELLDGHLTLDWSEPGKGSRFTATFKDHPADRGTALMKRPAPPPSLVPSFQGRRVLIAEDSEDNQMLMTSYLGATGIEITFADNGKKALELAMSSHYDLILMDIQMPEMDGFEATAQLRQKGWQGQILALTAHALQPERERAMKNGFNNYLVKPIKRDVLLTAISLSFSGLQL